MIAPRGAVITIENTAVVSIACPYSSYSVNPSFCAYARVRPPRAAWTVAFGIQAKAMNALSL